MKFAFGDIVVVNNSQIGVIIRSWIKQSVHTSSYDVYNRMTNNIESYIENDINRYMVRHKYLNEEELEYQENALQ